MKKEAHPCRPLWRQLPGVFRVPPVGLRGADQPRRGEVPHPPPWASPRPAAGISIPGPTNTSPPTLGPRRWTTSPLWRSPPDPAVHGLLAPLPPREPGDSPGLRPAHSPRGQRGGRHRPGPLPAGGGSPWPACGTWPPPCAWTRTGPTSWPSWPGWPSPRSLVLQAWEDPQRAADFAQQTGVSPVRQAGERRLLLRHLPDSPAGGAPPRPGPGPGYDTQVILEEAIPGFEVGCAVMGTQELVVGGDRRDRALPGLLQLHGEVHPEDLRHPRPRPGVSRHRPAGEGDRQGDLPGPGLHRLCPGGLLPHPRGADRVQRGQHHPRLYRAQPVPRHDEGRRLLPSRRFWTPFSGR